MKTIADLKRAVKQGVVLRLVAASYTHKFLGTDRIVGSTNTVGFSLICEPDKRHSYMDWPSRAELSFPADNQFRIGTPAGGHLTYEIVPPA